MAKSYFKPEHDLGLFVYVIRKRIKLSAEEAIFIFVDNVLPPTGRRTTTQIRMDSLLIIPRCSLSFVGAILSAEYEEKKEEDGFLYVTYSGENAFGC
ncbi:hypothetical protein SAY86_027947 [Trapa natans]|uniref:Autophagy-related protein n=1 Tax=Trapa natans TaxID=22666 RepID=A0AAN7MGJ9_TRANT|nr:hypothetical protein SAY86_027947 [Trapa natans]